MSIPKKNRRYHKKKHLSSESAVHHQHWSLGQRPYQFQEALLEVATRGGFVLGQGILSQILHLTWTQRRKAHMSMALNPGALKKAEPDLMVSWMSPKECVIVSINAIIYVCMLSYV